LLNLRTFKKRRRICD